MPDPVAPNTAPLNGIDPNVRMPPNVTAASRIAMEAHERAYPNGQGANDVQPPAPNGAQSAAANGQAELPLQQPELVETNPDGSVNWENRFKSLRGRWDQEQKRHRETVEQFEQRMNDVARENRKLKQPQFNDQSPMPMITDKERDDYGADLIEIMKRAAVEAVLPMLKPIAQTVGQVQARVETTENETGKQFLSRMHGTMDNTVPGWQELNEDPNFIAWTKRSDVYSGLNRQELLQKAWYAGDSNRVAAFFRGYLAEEAAVDPAAAQARQQAYPEGMGHPQPNGAAASVPQGQPASRVTLESLAAPGRARVAATAPAGKPVWTADGISTFYMDVANGKFRGRDAERIATEADLMSAQREGRIQVNPRTATTLG
jgi:hypothetical protein